ncbi:hypothetical protein BIV57_19065 [Mangrovactinospora gilvigrisea]|uniref:Lipoprotein n=2 Tax=Mangrovactinospora gilvigrisea TaxID=1428644 RepID=A0A1J7BB72_9ACTN|nr:hypothetical protein BIV57_19065 [Mangrovactinospora gilvigrisea]
MWAPAACAAAAAVTLAGCASSGGGKGTIKGASDGGATSASPSAGPSAAAIKLPSDFTIDFAGWTRTGNGPKDAVLADAQNFIRSVRAAEAYHDRNGPFRKYSDGAAATRVSQDIASMSSYKGGVTITGTDRYSQNKVEVTGTRAAVTYCDNQSGTYSKVMRTGAVLRTSASPKDYLRYANTLQKDADGVWKTMTIQVTEDASCRS